MNVAAGPLTAAGLNPMVGVLTDTPRGFCILDLFKERGVTIADTELVQLLIGIARLGYRGPIKEHSLSSLVAYAKDHGVSTVLEWIREEPGYLVVPSWQFLLAWQVRRAGDIENESS